MQREAEPITESVADPGFPRGGGTNPRGGGRGGGGWVGQHTIFQNFPKTAWN